jgi:glycine cleavage system H lipoate-binding protein
MLVIGFLLLFIPFWRLLNRPARAVFEAAERVSPGMGGWFRLPEEVFYHLGHSWAVSEGKNVVKVGMNDFAQKLVGKIDAIQVPALGSTVYQGERGWALKVDSRAIDMLSPVDGKVIAVNEEVLRAPQTINQDPYRNWLMKVESPSFSVDKRQLLSGAMARRWMEEVRENLMSRMSYDLGAVYQDGGLLVDGMARQLDREKWDGIAKEFFLVSEG